MLRARGRSPVFDRSPKPFASALGINRGGATGSGTWEHDIGLSQKRGNNSSLASPSTHSLHGPPQFRPSPFGRAFWARGHSKPGQGPDCGANVPGRFRYLWLCGAMFASTHQVKGGMRFSPPAKNRNTTGSRHRLPGHPIARRLWVLTPPAASSLTSTPSRGLTQKGKKNNRKKKEEEKKNSRHGPSFLSQLA